MGAVVAVAIIVVWVAAWSAYRNYLVRGIRTRTMRTTRSEAEVRQLFRSKVAGMGWSVVDDDNPMVAQSPLLAGRRQQISLEIQRVPGGLDLKLFVSRMWTKGVFARMPYKAHTLRMRMNAFERAVGTPGAVPAAPVVAPPTVLPPTSPVPPVSAPMVAPASAPAIGQNPFLAPPAPPAPPAPVAPVLVSPSAPVVLPPPLPPSDPHPRSRARARAGAVHRPRRCADRRRLAVVAGLRRSDRWSSPTSCWS